MSIKVTLRKRQLPSGKITLYLDFYPAIRNPKTMQLSRREYLGIYLTSRPANRAEKMIHLPSGRNYRLKTTYEVLRNILHYILSQNLNVA